MNGLRPYIREQGFEETLEDLIDYAAQQAHLYQSLGVKDRWEYWVKSWMSLESAASQISSCYPMEDWEKIWTQYLSDQNSTLR